MRVVFALILLTLFGCGAPPIFVPLCQVTPYLETSSAGTKTGSKVTCLDSQTIVWDGQNGSNGTNGANGTNGTNGKDGKDGKDGSDGAPGSQVTIVRFCPSQGGSTYPSHFPEVGICIDGHLIGTYWDRANLNAWSTEIVPGHYSSTSTGLACSFTVGANCTVLP